MSFLHSIQSKSKKHEFPFDHWEYDDALTDEAIKEIATADIPDVSKHNLSYDGTRAIDGGGAEFREGTTPYDVMLENNVNQAFNITIADYNSEMDFKDQLNQSLMLEAKAAGQEYAGRMTARSQKFAAVGSLLGDANKIKNF